MVTVSYPVRHSGAPWHIKDAPPDRRTHACAERGGEPGIHFPEACVHGFRASPFRRSRNDVLGRAAPASAAVWLALSINEPLELTRLALAVTRSAVGLDHCRNARHLQRAHGLPCLV